ncbi:MAG: hypothetical protein MUE48_05060 [Desulfobacterales bacterium]|jgi:hypothetical protein|nr:hypothetical protein [Desulfobacterales bacterium]
MGQPSAGPETHGTTLAAAPKLPLVHLRYEGRPIGLYGIREAYETSLVLLHGPIAFPVGTRLLVEDLLGVYRGLHARMFPATVTDSDGWGMTLSL